MTQHLHPEHVPGCYRCDLREDEARDHQTARVGRPDHRRHGGQMSACISRHGEYSSHDPDEDHIARTLRAALAAPTDTTKEN